MREPLPGWFRMPSGSRGLKSDGLELWATDESFDVDVGWELSRIETAGCPQLAAEDGARALAADIVAALGGSVTWPTGGGDDGNQ